MVAFAHQPAKPYVTLEEYERIEVETGIKHEWFNGQIWPLNGDLAVDAMAGATSVHNTLAVNISGLLHNQLRGKPCRTWNSDQRIRVAATELNAYPDVLVACPPHQWENEREITLLNPKILIEVLSPSTADYDRGEKWEHYRQLESLSDYLLISSDRLQIMHYHRQPNNDWLLHIAQSIEETIRLESIDCSLPLRDVYERIEFSSPESR